MGWQLRAIEFNCLHRSLLGHCVIQLNASEPVTVLRRFATDDIEKHGLYFFGDWATTACTDLTAIQFTYRCYFSGGAGEEGLISAIHFITRDTLFNHFNA